MKAHRFAHLILLFFSAVAGGCQTSRTDTRTSASAPTVPSASGSLKASGAVETGGDLFLSRAVSECRTTRSSSHDHSSDPTNP